MAEHDEIGKLVDHKWMHFKMYKKGSADLDDGFRDRHDPSTVDSQCRSSLQPDFESSRRTTEEGQPSAPGSESLSKQDITTRSLLKSLGKMQRRGDNKKKEVAAESKTGRPDESTTFSYFLGYRKTARSKERESGARENVVEAEMAPEKSESEAQMPAKPAKPQIRAHSAIESAFFNEMKRKASASLRKVKNQGKAEVAKSFARDRSEGSNPAKKGKCKRCLKKSRFMLLRRPHFQDELERIDSAANRSITLIKDDVVVEKSQEQDTHSDLRSRSIADLRVMATRMSHASFCSKRRRVQQRQRGIATSDDSSLCEINEENVIYDHTKLFGYSSAGAGHAPWMGGGGYVSTESVKQRLAEQQKTLNQFSSLFQLQQQVAESASSTGEDGLCHKVLIKNDQFVPSYLQVHRNDVVEWSVLPDAVEESQSSLYYHDSRSHVISFDNLNEESEALTSKRNSTFKVRFHETGFFTYRCQIYTRMLGAVEVVERQGVPYSGRPVVQSVEDLGEYASKAAVTAPVSRA